MGMEHETGKSAGAKTPNTREVRLKAALKANMAKRKAQARDRAKAQDAAETDNKKE
jgi:hypothetical protein